MLESAGEASWRSGDAEDCKSLYGGSIPSEASISYVSDTLARLLSELLRFWQSLYMAAPLVDLPCDFPKSDYEAFEFA